MGIDPKRLNDKQIGMITNCDQRKAVVKARGYGTQQEIDLKAEVKNERQLHDQYISFLRRNRLPYIHANPVKESTIQKGCPDFCVTPGERQGQYGGHYLYGEFKLPGKKLSPEQVDYHAMLKECGCPVRVWYSYEQAVAETDEFFGLQLMGQ